MRNYVRAGMFLLLMSFVVFGEQRQNPDSASVDPEFTISTMSTTYFDSATNRSMPGITFMATPNMNVYLSTITIQAPIAPPSDIPMENRIFLRDKQINLGTFPKVGGDWIFTFKGKHETGDQEGFSVPVTKTVTE